MGIDNGDLSRLCKPFTLPFYHRLINAGLYYLVTGVVRPVHIESFLIESEADRKGGILDQNEMGRVKRHRKRRFELLCLPGHPAGYLELPETQVL